MRRGPASPGLLALVMLLLAAVVGGCDMPHDTAGTLRDARGGTLRAGAIESPPWAVVRDGAFDGVEVALVSRFADEIGAADVEWITGSESSLITALNRRELDVVVGGLTAGSPWAAEVGFSIVYLDSAVAIGVPPDTGPVPKSWAGERLGYPAGDLEIAALIRERGAIPVPVDGPAGIAVAAPRWQLVAWGLEPREEDLRQRRHVLAVPPGENAFLLRLDRFLAEEGPAVRRRLQSARR
jgi:polar amino acid transport system substrate-binding protein